MTALFKTHPVRATVDILLLALGLSGVWLGFLYQFEFPHQGVIWAVGLFWLALFSALFLALPGRRVAQVLVPLLVLWLWAAWVWRYNMMYIGSDVAAGYFLPEMHRIVSYAFPVPPVPTPAEEWWCVAFCAWFLAPFTCLSAYAQLRCKSALLGLLATVPFFFFAYCLKGIPPAPLMVLQFGFWVTLFLQPGRLLREGRVGAGIQLVSLALACSMLGGLLYLRPREQFKPSSAAYTVRDKIVELAVNIEYAGIFRGLSGFSSGSPLTSADGTVNLNSAGSIRFAERDVMEVTTTAPHNLYLRAYAAGEYTGSAWLQDEAAGFDGLLLSYEPMEFMGEVGPLYFLRDPATITVDLQDTNSNFLFTPYMMTGLAADPAPVWAGDAYLPADGQQHYTAKSYAGMGIDSVIIGVRHTGLREYLFNASLEYGGTGGALEFEGYELYYSSFSQAPVFYAMNELPLEVLYDAFLYYNNPPAEVDVVGMFYPEYYPDAAYMRHIVDEYTALPEGLGDTLLRWWTAVYHSTERDNPVDYVYASSMEEQGYRYGSDSDIYAFSGSAMYAAGVDPGPNTPYWNWVQAARLVAEEVRKAGAYSTDPGAQPRNRDFVEYFLTEGQKGYCVHFASATTAVLRALGIPARYVEGYVVGEGSFDAEGRATVPAKNAHAWAEIWVPNFGWMPVDATPGGVTVSEGIAAPVRAEDVASPNPNDPDQAAYEEEWPEPAPDETEGGQESGKDRDEGDAGETARRRAVMAGEFAALLVPAGLLAGRYGARWLRRRRFADRDRRRAVLYLYAHLQSLGSEMPPGATELAEKARFSREVITDGELLWLQGQVPHAEAEARTRATRPGRVLLWLRGL